jgi:hypothetical protein
VEAGPVVSDVKSINRFEANLVRLARFVVGGLSAAQGRALLLQECPRPRCLSRAAVQLVQDTLAKGCVRLLARHGGWRRERFLRSNQIADGYLWQRTPPTELALHFSRHTLELLLWLTAENVDDGKMSRRGHADTDLTPADAFVCYHVLTALEEANIRRGLVKRLGLARQNLCRLAFPREYATLTLEPPPGFSRWTKGLAGCILETMQTTLANHWLAVERGKRQIADWQHMQALGRAQETILHAYLDALEKAGRQDLARFLLMLLADLLAADDVRAANWIGGLKTAGARLADRATTHEAALVVVRQLPRLQRWERQARSVGYFDENYAASQLWKSDWERWQGEKLCRRADVLLRELNLLAGEGTR